ncbi:MAG: S1 RNA-binding domain-containing protein [Anaerolineaceae bacterium]|nr:S1 RNA-binding domain-containing protein [Anaerolineaceae bacterium]
MENTTKPVETSTEEIQAKQKFVGKVLKTTLQGALVDIGSKLPAFIHISQVVKDNNPKTPINSIEDVLKVDQEVNVWVKRVRKDRIELSMVEPLALEWRELKPDLAIKGKVVRLETFGVFVDIGAERPGLVHISELAHNYVRTPGEVVKEGDEIDVMVLEVNRKKKQIKLSMKALMELPPEPEALEPRKPSKKRGKSRKQDAEEVVVEVAAPEPTAMEFALRQAMDRSEKSEKTKKDESSSRTKKSKEIISAQDEIFERPLKSKSDSE